MGLSFSDVAEKMTRAFSYQLFGSGFVHGDPHPGNSKPHPHYNKIYMYQYNYAKNVPVLYMYM